MQNSIMDLYGLIHFIDETVFPDEKAFYERYFRKPENYPELAERVSKFCFRTTRPEVANYVKIPDRIPITAEFTLTPKEQELYDLLDAYVQRENKAAFPHMDQYDLALLLFRTFSSSTFALDKLFAASSAGWNPRPQRRANRLPLNFPNFGTCGLCLPTSNRTPRPLWKRNFRAWNACPCNADAAR